MLVAPHPKTDGSVEEKIIQEAGARNVRVLRARGKAPPPATPALCRVAQLVACHQSSAGLQAVHGGKPVLYVADRNTYGNYAIKQGLASIAGTASEVGEAIPKLLATAGNMRPSLARMGIPSGAANRLAAALEAALEAALDAPAPPILDPGRSQVPWEPPGP